MTPRSYLFVPGDRPDRFDKALGAGADAVIIDLEDAVAPPAKSTARDALATWLCGATAGTVMVRVNASHTRWFSDDLQVCAHPAVGGIVVPKAEDAGVISAVAAGAPGKAVLPLIETAAGFDALRTVAGAAGVARLVFGSIDFQADLGIEGDDDALLFFRSRLVWVSRLAGLAAPVDGVTAALGDAAAVERDTARARRLGFGAKLCIHPQQVAAVNRGFMPSAAELEWAQRVLAAAEASGGAAVAVDGRMVDAPVLLRARRLMERAAPLV
jgi:citrate lyase subunit beta / citryl-CoA lyase